MAAEPARVDGLRRLYVVLTRAVSRLRVVHDEPLPAELGLSRPGPLGPISTHRPGGVRLESLPYEKETAMGFLDRAKEKADELAKQARPMAEQAKDKAGPMARQAKDKAGPMAKQAKREGRAGRAVAARAQQALTGARACAVGRRSGDRDHGYGRNPWVVRAVRHPCTNGLPSDAARPARRPRPAYRAQGVDA